MLSGHIKEELKLPPINNRVKGMERLHVEEFRSERKHLESIDLTV